MICVLILTPIPALRAGLRALLSDNPNIQIVGAASSMVGLTDFPTDEGVLVATREALDEHVLEKLARQEGWSLLLVGDDPAAVYPAVLPAAVTILVRGLPAGRAWGQISTDSGSEALQAALAALSEGLCVVSSGVMAQIVSRIPADRNPIDLAAQGEGDGSLAPENLTERETDVLRLAAEGLTNKQIALKLGISEHTVKFHVSSIYAKFGVSNRAEAVRNGARWGWVPL